VSIAQGCCLLYLLLLKAHCGRAPEGLSRWLGREACLSLPLLLLLLLLLLGLVVLGHPFLAS
jgi:hypothetical protein